MKFWRLFSEGYPGDETYRDLLFRSFEGFRDGIVEVSLGTVSQIRDSLPHPLQGPRQNSSNDSNCTSSFQQTRRYDHEIPNLVKAR